MGNENGTWIMRGLSENDPACIRTSQELISYIDKVGFLPLFKNSVPGFSVEEHVSPDHWWTGDIEKDPWEWRAVLARSGRVAYGKFFENKAGFISRAYLPDFVNFRRDGYDFDALWDDEKATFRQKKIMDCFEETTELFSNELKEAAGYGKDGEKNFEGIVSDLQMRLYLCVRDFRQRLNKKGMPYGWAIAVFCLPEHLWGREHIASAYACSPASSRERIVSKMKELYPSVTDAQIVKLIGRPVGK